MTTTLRTLPPAEPVSLPFAAKWLKENRPEWGYSVGQLRGMCMSRNISCIRTSRASAERKMKWQVRIPKMLQEFELLEKKAMF